MPARRQRNDSRARQFARSRFPGVEPRKRCRVAAARCMDRRGAVHRLRPVSATLPGRCHHRRRKILAYGPRRALHRLRAVFGALPGRLHRDAPGTRARGESSRNSTANASMPTPSACNSTPWSAKGQLTPRKPPRRMAHRSRHEPAIVNAAKRRAIFERFREANPDPRTELQYHTPFELLVAVILSAQATDNSVNKATAQLFRRANTPAAMLSLGVKGITRVYQVDRSF